MAPLAGLNLGNFGNMNWLTTDHNCLGEPENSILDRNRINT